MKCDIRREKINNLYIVSVTHNGYQWTAITLQDLNEVADLKEHIEEFLFEEKENKENISLQEKIKHKRIKGGKL